MTLTTFTAAALVGWFAPSPWAVVGAGIAMAAAVFIDEMRSERRREAERLAQQRRAADDAGGVISVGSTSVADAWFSPPGRN